MAQKRKSAQQPAKPSVLRRTVVDNKKARHLFEILDEFEAGMVLRGTEVKVLREGRISLDEAFGRIYDNDAFLVGAHIDAYSHASSGNHEPTRRRKLLLHRAEIRKLKAKVNQKGLTLVPLEVFFNERGIAKIRLGLCRGKKLHDKRQDLKKKDADREMKRMR
jgi:SsrA-binding protein